jgi:hypothetical protein
MRRPDEGREQDAKSFAILAKTQSTRFAHWLGPAHGASFNRPIACDWRLDLARSDVSDFNFAVPDA